MAKLRFHKTAGDVRSTRLCAHEHPWWRGLLSIRVFLLHSRGMWTEQSVTGLHGDTCPAYFPAVLFIGLFGQRRGVVSTKSSTWVASSLQRNYGSRRIADGVKMKHVRTWHVLWTVWVVLLPFSPVAFTFRPGSDGAISALNSARKYISTSSSWITVLEQQLPGCVHGRLCKTAALCSTRQVQFMNNGQ